MSTTRGVLRFGSATVQVLLTQHSDGQTIGSVALDLHGAPNPEPYHRLTAPSPKEAWAALATWIGAQLGSPA